LYIFWSLAKKQYEKAQKTRDFAKKTFDSTQKTIVFYKTQPNDCV